MSNPSASTVLIEAQLRVDHILLKLREQDIIGRPKYEEILSTIKLLEECNGKHLMPSSLEKEIKRQKSWLHRGEELFGIANTDPHALISRMIEVRDRNKYCLDIEDRPPETTSEAYVFCICRQPEAGMMVECERCIEWYHGACLEVSPGTIKEDDKWTCPICDWRVGIPRYVARPTFEDLQAWQADISTLPFEPEEEEVLNGIIDVGQEFRGLISQFTNPALSKSEEVGALRFYLRKIEGADILLTFETNSLRQMIHKLAPVAPDPPPTLFSI